MQPISESLAGRRILVVDDDPLVALTFKTFLTGDGHQVETAGSAEEALIKVHASHYDLVITDHILPHMTGVELARQLRLRLPAQPIILTSGSPQPIDPGEPNFPSVCLLGKPFVPQELKAAVAKTFAQL
jgi:CheY-like chemotaxis protein